MRSEIHSPAPATTSGGPSPARQVRIGQRPGARTRPALRERAVKAARKAGRTKPVPPGEGYAAQIVERLAQILELGREEKRAVRVEADATGYAGGRHPSLRLHVPAGDGAELVVVTGPDDGDLFHLVDPCTACGEPVPSYEFGTLAALGAALLWREVSNLFPAHRVPFSHIALVAAPHAERCPLPVR